MKWTAYLVPALIGILIVWALIKKVRIYDAFTDGIKRSLKLVADVFPYVAAILIMNSLLEKSGINKAIIDLLTPFFAFFAIPEEIVPLVVLKPFSGSGSLALLDGIYKTYGADGFIGRAASVAFGSGETVFYIAAVYYSRSKNKRAALPIIISLISIFIGTAVGCLAVKII